ncbi:MAG: hypothetical protein J0M19_14035, partial [Sphingomonadales bacterium]|nr:hypothetical protein [Sphingomonadales bacterium]
MRVLILSLASPWGARTITPMDALPERSMIGPLPETLKKKFSIKRYACCADWTAEDWLQALSARALFRLKLHSSKDRASAETMTSAVFALIPELRETLLREAEARLADPLMDLANPQPIPHIPRSLAVRDFVASDLYFVNKSLQGLDWEVCQDVVVRSFAWSDPA